MSEQILYCAGQTEALAYAAKFLQEKGFCFADVPSDSITHLLLDVPHKNAEQLPELLNKLPADITVLGGNLQTPMLQDYKVLDLLQDSYYLAENANITAHCAVKLALSMLSITLEYCPVLIIGWGRIGKCLAKLLRQMGADVSIYARKETDRAMLAALGYNALAFPQPCEGAPRIVFNTVPALVADSGDFSPECLKLELASAPGISGSNIVNARGLPNRFAPESSGQLIANSILRLCHESTR